MPIDFSPHVTDIPGGRPGHPGTADALETSRRPGVLLFAFDWACNGRSGNSHLSDLDLAWTTRRRQAERSVNRAPGKCSDVRKRRTATWLSAQWLQSGSKAGAGGSDGCILTLVVRIASLGNHGGSRWLTTMCTPHGVPPAVTGRRESSTGRKESVDKRLAIDISVRCDHRTCRARRRFLACVRRWRRKPLPRDSTPSTNQCLFD